MIIFISIIMIIIIINFSIFLFLLFHCYYMIVFHLLNIICLSKLIISYKLFTVIVLFRSNILFKLHCKCDISFNVISFDILY